MLVLAHASGRPWEWHPNPDIWAVIAVIAVGYWWAFTRLGPRVVEVGQPVATGRQVRTIVASLVMLWIASDYPIHEIASKYLMSVHMFQHLLLTLVVPGMLIAGTPDWLLRWLLVRPRRLHAVISKVGKPLIAGLIFNAVVAVTHWPVLVNFSLDHHPAHFVVHAVMFTTALLMWLPALNRVPELPHMSPPARMVYLFLQSILPTIPASFLTFAESPLYRFYAEAPRIWGMNPVEDQQLAGGIMKVIGGAILWGVIATMFFRWYAREENARTGELTWDDVERELKRTEATR